MSTENGEGFEWDENTLDADFFGEDTTKEDVVDTVLKADIDTEEKKEEPEAKTEEKKEEEQEPEFFSAEEDNEDEEEEESDEEEENGDGEPADKKSTEKKQRASKIKSTSALSFLKERGLVDYELEEDQELTEELADNILEDDFESRLDGRIEEIVEDMPEVAGNLFKYIKDGGNVNEFLLTLAQNQVSSGITANIDLTDEENQELVVREQMTLEGDDAETIEAQIEFYKSSNKLETIAQSKFKKWESADKQSKLALVEKQKAKAESQKKYNRELKATVTSLLKEKDDVGGLKLSTKEKKELPTYMTNKSVKLQGGGVITEMQKDLHEVLQDNEKAVILAKLLKSGFDFTSIENVAEDKSAKKVKEELKRINKRPSKSGSSGSTKKRKSLAEFF